MNSLCYKIIFSKKHGNLVAVGENTCANTKASGQGVRSGAGGFLRRSALSAAVFMAPVTYAAGLVASTLPQGATVNAGQVSIGSNAANMTITQISDKASLNWNSFSIGSEASVNVVQPNSSSVLLNRVIGTDPSQIFGKLSANGQIILVNQNGFVFGSSGSVTASAFTASTFDIQDADFLSGLYKFSRNNASSSIQLQNGSLIQTQKGGYIALLATNISNSATLASQGSNVVMAAGESITLPANIAVPLSSKVRLEISPASIQTAIANNPDGVILTQGGQVLMQAASVVDAVSGVAPAKVTQSGLIDTSAAQAGAVTLLANSGTLTVNGTIKANSSDANLQDDQGFVETSAAYLVVDDLNIAAKHWSIDPYNIEITDASTNAPGLTGYSILRASTIGSALKNGVTVTIDTNEKTGGEGHLVINSAIQAAANSSTSPATLNFNVAGNFTLNNNISVSNGGKLNLTVNAQNISTAKATNISTGGGQVTFNALANNASIKSNSNITTSGGNISFNSFVAGGYFQNTGNLIAGIGDISLYASGRATGSSVSGTLSAHNIAIDSSGGSGNVTTGSLSGTGSAGSWSGDTGLSLVNASLNASGSIQLAGATRVAAVGDGLSITSSNLNASHQIGVYGTALTAQGTGMRIADSAITAKDDILLTGVGNGGSINGSATLTSGTTTTLNDGSAHSGSSTLAGNIAASGGLVVNNNNSMTLQGVLTGGAGNAGGLTKNKAATLTLTGWSTATGAYTVNAGSLNLNNAIAQAHFVGKTININNGSSVSTGNKTLIFDGTIWNFGAEGGGTIRFTGNPLNYGSGNTFVTHGGATNTITGTFNLFVGDPVYFNIAPGAHNAAGLNIAGQMNNSFGSLNKTGAGTLLFTGASESFPTGAINIHEGLVQLGNGGTTGTLGTGLITLDANAALAIDHSNAITLTNTIRGTGTLVQTGHGLTVLSAHNAFEGLTRIEAGTLQIGDGLNTASALGHGKIVNNAHLVFRLKGPQTLANLMEGTGDLAIQVASSAANAHDGDLTLEADASGMVSQGDVSIIADGKIIQNSNLSAAGAIHLAAQGSIELNANLVNTNELRGLIDIHAGNGSITSEAKIVAKAGATVTQHSNEGVVMTTDGMGDLTPAKIINHGSGLVILGAGIQHTTSAGGNIQPLVDNPVIQQNRGKTFIYTGSSEGTGLLKYLDDSLTRLYLLPTTSALKNAHGQASFSTPANQAANTQVFFREKIGFNLDFKPPTHQEIYGASLSAKSNALLLNQQLLSQIKNSWAHTPVFTKSTSSGEFVLEAETVFQNYLTLQAPEDKNYNSAGFLKIGNYNYTYEPAITSEFDILFSGASKVYIQPAPFNPFLANTNKSPVRASSPISASKTTLASNNATSFNLASAEDLELTGESEICTNSDNQCVCQEAEFGASICSLR